MYNTQEAASWWTWLLHVPMVLMGAFLLVNCKCAQRVLSSSSHTCATISLGSAARCRKRRNADAGLLLRCARCCVQ